MQRNLLQQVLDRHPDLRFVAGNALLAEAAISVLRERGLRDRIGVVSTYFTPAVQRGILRGRILAAPPTRPCCGAALGRAGGRPARAAADPASARPEVQILDSHNLDRIEIGDSLPPPLLMPIFHYRPAAQGLSGQRQAKKPALRRFFQSGARAAQGRMASLAFFSRNSSTSFAGRRRDRRAEHALRDAVPLALV